MRPMTLSWFVHGRISAEIHGSCLSHFTHRFLSCLWEESWRRSQNFPTIFNASAFDLASPWSPAALIFGPNTAM